MATGSPPDLASLKIDRAPRRRSNGSGFGRFVPWLLLLLVAVALWMFRAPLMAKLDAWRLPVVDVVRVEKSSAAAASAISGTSANGYIVASRRAALSADTPGRIVELNVTEGSAVKQGEIVAKLYSEELEAALRQAEAALAATTQTVAQANADAQAARSDLPRLQKEVESAEASVQVERPMRDWYRQEIERFGKLAEQGVSDARRVDEARANLSGTEARMRAAATRKEAAEAALATGHAQVERMEAAVRTAEAQVPVLAAARDLAKATLSKTEVRAPFDGIVVLKDAEVGEVVSPNVQGGSNARGSVVTMVDFASLEAQAEVPETTLPTVVAGRPAKIFLDAYPDRPYTGVVSRIWPTANRSKGTVEVRVQFDAPDEFLRPELGVRVVFLGAQPTQAGQAQPSEASQPAQPRILISETCLVQQDGKTGVFALERDVLRFVALGLGERKSGRVVVESGLVGGEDIVQNPATSLKNGDRVQRKNGS
ncbi:MAG: efflux RND transporter periplasmic adaptor subunit [Planctomycetota bacterium]|nr:MAG: efflux RND transporter periplasmic adaptor subunit [Planctomycetota bacterium]